MTHRSPRYRPQGCCIPPPHLSLERRVPPHPPCPSYDASWCDPKARAWSSDRSPLLQAPWRMPSLSCAPCYDLSLQVMIDPDVLAGGVRRTRIASDTAHMRAPFSALSALFRRKEDKGFFLLRRQNNERIAGLDDVLIPYRPFQIAESWKGRGLRRTAVGEQGARAAERAR